MTSSTTTTTGASGASTTTSAPAKPTPAGTAIGPAKDVPVGQAAMFTDPHTQTPSIVIQPTRGRFVAYDAVCPHAGCTVGYLASQNIIACPCHGSVFNVDTGAVSPGPRPAGPAHDHHRRGAQRQPLRPGLTRRRPPLRPGG